MYYSKDIEKDSAYRQDYVEGIELFLLKEKVKADTARGKYISPKKYKGDPEKYRRALCKTLGFPLNKKVACPALLKKEFIARDKNVNIYRMQFLFFGCLKFYGVYLEQTEDKKEKPFVVGIHGGGGTAEYVSSMCRPDSGNYHDLIRRITDKGANVFAPQLLLWTVDLFGNKYDRVLTDGKLRQLGGSVTALELYLLRGAISYFIEKEELNAEKTGVTGLSYGGMYAAYLAATDTRIKACYSCGWVNDCFVNSWADWSYFNAQKKFTTAETVAMIAPRALIIAIGDNDEVFDSKLTLKECDKIKPYYTIFGKGENFKTVIFNGVHEADKSDEEINFLIENLVDNK